MDSRIIKCVEYIDYLPSNLIAVKLGEEVLITIDPQTDVRMADAIAAVALKCGVGYNISMMPICKKDKATIPPRTPEKVIETCDVSVGMTAASSTAIYNNRLKELINERRLREISIYLRNINNFTRGGALADYEKAYADELRLQEIWGGHKIARVTILAGTNIMMEMDQMEPIIECGIARNSGDAIAWSGGEVSLGSVIGMMEGITAVDGPICYYGCPITLVELRVEKGRIVEVAGGDPKTYKEIRRQIRKIKDSDNITEISLGLNPVCMLSGDFGEEKKARRTPHLVMSNGFYYGQLPRSTTHINMMLYSLTVYFGDVLIEEDGRLICLGEE